MQSNKSASNGQSGQGMVEYALILVLVSIVVIVVLLTMGQQINNVRSEFPITAVWSPYRTSVHGFPLCQSLCIGAGS